MDLNADYSFLAELSHTLCSLDMLSVFSFIDKLNFLTINGIQNNSELSSFAVQNLFIIWKLCYGYLELLVGIKKK